CRRTSEISRIRNTVNITSTVMIMTNELMPPTSRPTLPTKVSRSTSMFWAMTRVQPTSSVMVRATATDDRTIGSEIERRFGATIAAQLRGLAGGGLLGGSVTSAAAVGCPAGSR